MEQKNKNHSWAPAYSPVAAYEPDNDQQSWSEGWEDACMAFYDLFRRLEDSGLLSRGTGENLRAMAVNMATEESQQQWRERESD